MENNIRQPAEPGNGPAVPQQSPHSGIAGAGLHLSVPPPHPALWRNFPPELRNVSQWAFDADATSALTGAKRPQVIGPSGTIYDASSTKPEQWLSFDMAKQTAHQNGRNIGFMLTKDTGLTVIDIDITDAETQVWKGQPIDESKWTTPAEIEECLTLARAFGSYAERSRSGKGLHVFIKGQLNGSGIKRKRGNVEIEVYDHARFIICTGKVLDGVTPQITDQQELLDTLIERLGGNSARFDLAIPDGPQMDDDDALLARARSAANAEKFALLWEGRWKERPEYPSPSEADMAFVSILAFYSRNNEQVRRLFRQSGLARSKTNKNNYHIDRMLRIIRTEQSAEAAKLQEVHIDLDAIIKSCELRLENARRKRRFRLLLDVDMQNLPRQTWFVKRIIPSKGVGAIFGQSGTFKSFLALDLLAHISNGRDWFGHRVRGAPAVYVPFEGQGGIPKRVKAWRLAQADMQGRPEVIYSQAPDDIQSRIAVILDKINLREQADRDTLVETLIENGWAGGVLCIDTLAHASQGLDENSSQMGEMISVLSELQRRLGGVVLVIHHAGKSDERGMRGWSGIHAAMDFILECRRPDKKKLDAEFALTKIKDDEDGKTYRFSVRPIHIGCDEDGDEITSLTVVPPCLDTTSSSPISGADRDAEDDQFVWQWVKDQVVNGDYPSSSSLEGQRMEQMSLTRQMTQKRLRDAVSRLKAASRIVTAPDKSPSGNSWLRAVDTTKH